jgi:spore coat polysaccharide biosynthesis predicted glycosyltransferase SpsG
VNNLLILADGGDSIGFGHIMRCLAIKDCWHHGSATLLVQMKGGGKAPDDAINYNWLDHIETLKKFTTKNTSLLVDSYQTNTLHFQQLKKIFPFITVLDDYNRMVYPVDLIICPGVYGKDINYSNQIANICGGPEYVIIRPEILALPKVELNETVNSVLLTLGGSQKSIEVFQMIVDIFENKNYQLIVVTGSNQLAKQLKSKKATIYGELDRKKMATIMENTDIAITSAGQTINEFSWLGIPLLSIKTGEDQHYNWVYYNQYVLSSTSSSEKLNETILTFIKNNTYSKRQKISNELKGLLTSTGANLICTTIKNFKGINDE